MQSSKLKWYLTVRYIVALLLIAVVTFGGYLVFQNLIKSNKQNSYVINISGMQRMLSQRIGLMAREIQQAGSVEAADRYIEKMEASLVQMQDNHSKLTKGEFERNVYKPLSEEIKAIYFGSGGIDESLTYYFSIVNQYIALYKSQGLSALNETELTNHIAVVARNGLLDQLNSAVSRYELEAEKNIHAIEQLELIFVFFVLLILLLEAFFIFQPVVNRVAKTTSSIELANKELIEFAYRISHDLRAPIVSSLGLSKVAYKFLDKGDSDNAKKSILHISNSMVKLEKLIEDIVILTKTKMLDVKKERVEIEKLVDDTLSKLDNLPDFDRIVINKNISCEPSFNLKLTALQQVLENLISNAIKYSDSNEVRSTIDIEVVKSGLNLVISVRDNGIGIPEANQKEVFGMFKRFHTKVSFGSGLGLYIVLQQVNILKGSIDYISHEKGSEFKLIIPV